MRNTIHRFGMLADGFGVGVATSGGADSVGLLRALSYLANEYRWRLVVLHVNHKLRGEESDADARFVDALATELGLFCDSADLPLRTAGNLEQEGRNVRYAWLRKCTKTHSLHAIALGHTRSDQAETVLFRLLRGSGGAGLSGIRPSTNDGFVRPLLYLTRDEVRDYLRELGQPWREDSSNKDTSFDRNRIRLGLLPQLALEWNPSIDKTLAQTAEWAQSEEEYWESLIVDIARRTLQNARGGGLVCENEAIASLPIAVARRLIRHAIQSVRGDLQAIDFAHVERIRVMLHRKEGSARLQIPGVDIMRSFEWVRFAPPGSYGGERHFRAPVPIPGTISLPECDSCLTFRVERVDYRYNGSVNCLDRDRIAGPLELRTWQPGDQFRPVGHSSEVKLKTLFQEARIPLWERRMWPVLVTTAGYATADSIVWSRRFGAAAAFAAGPDTREAIAIAERSPGFSDTPSRNRNQEPDVRRL